ncbi:hypothetical protein IEQ34_014997 [Dendrobium chrysotoxum]|uniref:Uncharacterized protein n=1 Tax=Dendrobium chrysotoxum TaxID=161865 RepID=A0AAV7GLJ0_DENCH|nr:hypothetical protein IEQ34_014997 [Dendrobium chrysotoxum]
MERSSSYENSWADQWDYGDDPVLPTGKMNSVGHGGKNGVEKTKAMAATGLKKMKQGTTSGFNWIKDKYQKRAHKQ